MSRIRDEEGAVAAMVAILAIALIGMAAFVVDFGVAYSNKRQVSTAADAAVLAAANSLAELNGSCAAIKSSGGAAAEALATSYISGASATISDAQVVPGSFTIDCPLNDLSYGEVTLDARADTQQFFGGLFGGGPANVTRSATARFGTITNPGGLRPYAVCAGDAIQLRANSLDNDPNNDVLVVSLPNNAQGQGSRVPRTAALPVAAKPAPKNTDTTLTVSPLTNVTTQDEVTLTATVTVQGGTPIPNVSVVFLDKKVQLGTANTDALGVAELKLKLPAGNLSLSASFIAPNSSDYADSASRPAISLDVVQAAPPTTAPPTTGPPTTTAPPTTEPPLETGPCGNASGEFGQLDFTSFPTEDECEQAYNGTEKIFACYIRDGYNEPLTLPATIAGETGNDCGSECEDAWVTLRERQIALPVYTNIQGGGNNTSFTAPYVLGVKVCGYWFGSNTQWASPTCGKPWSTVTPEPKNVDTLFQLAFTRLVVSGSVGGSGCDLGANCDLLRGVVLAPGPGGKS